MDGFSQEHDANQFLPDLPGAHQMLLTHNCMRGYRIIGDMRRRIHWQMTSFLPLRAIQLPEPPFHGYPRLLPQESPPSPHSPYLTQPLGDVMPLPERWLRRNPDPARIDTSRPVSLPGRWSTSGTEKCKIAMRLPPAGSPGPPSTLSSFSHIRYGPDWSTHVVNSDRFVETRPPAICPVSWLVPSQAQATRPTRRDDCDGNSDGFEK